MILAKKRPNNFTEQTINASSGIPLKEPYLTRQDNTIYTFSIKVIFLKYRIRQLKTTETNK